LALRLARHWNRDPNWFYTLDHNTRVAVLAEYRLSNESPDQTKKRYDNIKQQKLQKMLDKAKGG